MAYNQNGDDMRIIGEVPHSANPSASLFGFGHSQDDAHVHASEAPCETLFKEGRGGIRRVLDCQPFEQVLSKHHPKLLELTRPSEIDEQIYDYLGTKSFGLVIPYQGKVSPDIPVRGHLAMPVSGESQKDWELYCNAVGQVLLTQGGPQVGHPVLKDVFAKVMEAIRVQHFDRFADTYVQLNDPDCSVVPFGCAGEMPLNRVQQTSDAVAREDIALWVAYGRFTLQDIRKNEREWFVMIDGEINIQALSVDSAKLRQVDNGEITMRVSGVENASEDVRLDDDMEAAIVVSGHPESLPVDEPDQARGQQEALDWSGF